MRIPLSIGLAVLAGVGAGCHGSLRLTPSDAEQVLAAHRLEAADPAQPGRYAVRSLYYGSGTDRRRAEYRDSVSLRTQPVNASKLVDLGDAAGSRNEYWGFTPEQFPVNARVWYPVGDGPFPLVLIVHGNHDMKEFSDPGYAYLGELLASRGFVFASVDMNFLNGGIRQENDARGWLLLKHLEAWRAFNAADDNPFAGKVDLDRIALIGHSRGGEAVGHAAAFNRLARYPDDAAIEFDFGFGIRSIIAIAPVDGQYRPADRFVPVDDVSYLVFHGSHDGDVSSFHGLRQYQRVTFTDSVAARAGPHPFKSAVYVYRANHGQWNTVWGPHDAGRRSPRILELGGLLDEEEQRRFGKVYIAAFLEATLHEDERYLPLFRDHRVIGAWLPKTMYITRFEEPSLRSVATFDDDIDVTTGSVPGVVLAGDSLQTWKEAGLQLRTANSPAEGSGQHNHAVWLGWNRRIAGQDSTRLGAPSTYTITLPDSLPRAWGFDRATSLEMLLAPLDDEPGPRKSADDERAGEGERQGESERERERGRARKGDDRRTRDKPPMDLTIELEDTAGAKVRVPLSRYGAVRRPLEIRVLRRGDREKQVFDRPYEIVLQTYSIPLAELARQNPTLDLSAVRHVRLVFDRTVSGTVIVDRIGFARMNPSFVLPAGPLTVR